MSAIEGEASYFRSDATDWTGVAVNAPLITGDRFYSGRDSRAEIALAPGIDARLGDTTELDMVELAPEATQVRLALGHAIFRARKLERRHVEIDTPAAAVVLDRPGVVRIDVDQDGRVAIGVREGEVAVHTRDGEARLGPGRGEQLSPAGDPLDTYALGAPDALDSWEQARAGRIGRGPSSQYVSDQIYGGEDLDEYGTWDYRRGYGQVWRPTAVDPGWAPYSNGRWVWVPPWGWTWLDYAAWGWAPFHYGRWVYLDDGWWWAPGPVIADPIYSPALVAFYGYGLGGASVSVSIGVGPAIGWVPLGWGEPCLPWWGGWGGVRVGKPWWGGWGGPRVVNNVVINQTNIYKIHVDKIVFKNRDVPGGISVVPQRSFLSGEDRRIRLHDAGLRDLRPIEGRVPLAPDRASLPPTAPSRVQVARDAIPPREASVRPVVMARTPQRPDALRPPTAPREASPLPREDGGMPRHAVAPRPGGEPAVSDAVVGHGAKRPATAENDGVARPPVDAPGTERSVVVPRPDGAPHTPYVAHRPSAPPDSSGGRQPIGVTPPQPVGRSSFPAGGGPDGERHEPHGTATRKGLDGGVRSGGGSPDSGVVREHVAPPRPDSRATLPPAHESRVVVPQPPPAGAPPRAPVGGPAGPERFAPPPRAEGHAPSPRVVAEPPPRAPVAAPANPVVVAPPSVVHGGDAHGSGGSGGGSAGRASIGAPSGAATAPSGSR